MDDGLSLFGRSVCGHHLGINTSPVELDGQIIGMGHIDAESDCRQIRPFSSQFWTISPTSVEPHMISAS